MSATSAEHLNASTQVAVKKLFMKWFLASLSILFAASIVAYMITWSQQSIWPPRLTMPDGSVTVPHLPFATLILGTIVIIISSVTMFLARASAQRGEWKLTAGYLATTLGLGLLFLGLQSWNWIEINAIVGSLQATASLGYNLFLFLFYTFTAVHAAHVIGGLIPLAITTISLYRATPSATATGDEPDRPTGVLMLGWYWHFLDIVWLLLFVMIVATWYIPLFLEGSQVTQPLPIPR